MKCKVHTHTNATPTHNLYNFISTWGTVTGNIGLLSTTMNSDKNVLSSGVSKCNVVLHFEFFSLTIVCLYISLHHTLGPGKLVLL